MTNRLILGDSFDPWRNLAAEELLFEGLGEDECVFYLWQNRNTVVIGRHQNAWKECRVQLLEDEGGRLARRSSGGGAVYHDLGNLNFTYLIGRGECDVRRQLEVIRRAVAAFGIESEFSGRNDLLTGGAKFSGNAFRYSRTAALHHGTLMVNVDMDRVARYLAPDPGKLRAKGIESVRSRVRNLSELNPAVTVEALREALIHSFSTEYGRYEVLNVTDLDPEALRAKTEKYASWDFRLGRALPFDASLERRFPWGGVTLALRLREGRVEQTSVWSDAMDVDMIDRIPAALSGARYESASLARAMRRVGGEQAEDLARWLAEEPL